MRTVKVYTKEGCQFSAQLKSLLDANDIPYEETNVTLDSPEHHELGERTGSMKLPQAFIGVIPLGSYGPGGQRERHARGPGRRLTP